MKILLTTFTFPPAQNGVSEVAAAHAYGLAARGHQVIVATECDQAQDISNFRDGVEIVQFKLSGNGNLLVGYKGEIKKYQQFVSSFKGDVIINHCWQIWSTDLTLTALADTDAKSILVSHGFNANAKPRGLKSFINWLAWRPYVRRLPKMLKTYDHVVHLSSRRNRDVFYDRYVGEKLGLENYSVIPNGVYLENHDGALPDFRLLYNLGSGPMILYVANYNKYKNQEMALRAYALAGRADVTMVFIGSLKNDYSTHVERVYKKLQKENKIGRVLFLEMVNKSVIYAAYRAANLFLCPSRLEVQPLIVLDAMASRTPFISTDVGCVADFPGGLIVRSTKEMAQQISDLMQSPQMRHRLGEEGRAASEETYSWPKVIDGYEHLFTHLSAKDS